MFIDVGFCQKKKYNQHAFGDYFISKRYRNSEKVIAVLSDGLGSGIKANILACMTATMLLKFIESHIDIKTACETIMNSLPVCKIRNISYSTFSALECDDNGNVKIIEEGNPSFLWIRNNSVLNPSFDVITSKTFPDRFMHIYNIKLIKDDRIIFCSDGITQAALGSEYLKNGIGRDGLIEMVLKKLKEFPKISSNELCRYIIKQVELIVPEHKLKDDTSMACFYFREPRKAILFTGPPYNSNEDNLYAKSFYEFDGKKAIAGGTTANIIARELNLNQVSNSNLLLGELPDVSYMDGVDLVTEGILTLTKTVEYLEQNNLNSNDSAGKLVRFLLNSDELKFMVGAKINQAHYNPSFPVEIEIRKNVIKKIANILENKYSKKVIIKLI